MDTGPLSPENYTAEEVARLLKLEPLEQEGGYARRTAEADMILGKTARRAYSVIYMLITPSGFSAMHRLGADEIWCFHAGDPLESLRLSPDGSGRVVHLGANPRASEAVHDIVLANVWQGTRLLPGGRWALVSCVVVPEFRWSDFLLGERDKLVARYPAFAGKISELTR